MISNIIDYLDTIKQYGKKDAFAYVDDNDESVFISYERFIEDVKMCALCMHEKYSDISGKHVGIFSQNRYEYFVILFSLLLNKAVGVLINTQESVDRVLEDLRKSDVEMLYSDGSDPLDENFEIPKLPMNWEKKDISNVDFTKWQQDYNLDKLAMILFTSGTTGVNKGVMISFRNIFGMLQFYVDLKSEFNKIDKESLPVLLAVPFYHAAGFGTIANNLLGHCIIIEKSAKYIYRDLSRFSIKNFTAAPIFLEMFKNDIKNGHRERLGDLKLVLCGGASLNHELIHIFSEAGIYLVDVYGMTENMGIGVLSKFVETNIEKKLNSVGVSYIPDYIKIIDNEICFKGDIVTPGYYNDEELTREVFDQDGWFHTGDLGYLDDEGYLYITGRKKNLIILASGENVSPEELEKLILKCDYVEECIVKEKNKKIACEIYGENHDLIREYVGNMNKTLPMYKRIGIIEFRDEPFERNALGKIKR